MNGGFQKEALERLVDYAYTAQLEIPGDEVLSFLFTKINVAYIKSSFYRISKM